MFEIAKKVFKLPLDTKIKYQMDGKAGVYYGYKAPCILMKKTLQITANFGIFQKMKSSFTTKSTFVRLSLKLKRTWTFRIPCEVYFTPHFARATLVRISFFFHFIAK